MDGSNDAEMGGRRSCRGSRTWLRLAVALLVLLAFVGSAGPAVAHGHTGTDGNPGRSCPGENPNVGFVRSSDQANESSASGIARAAQAIGC